MRIGVLGGTFDPPHLAHLVVASEVCETLALDRVLFVPAALPPHKRGAVHASPELRLEMTAAAIAGDPRLAVDDLELRRPGPSYTVDTLRALGERWPGASLFFIVGADQLREFHTWREPEEITRLARLAVVARGGEPLENPAGVGISPVPIPRLDISSSGIRQRVAEDRGIRYLVPDGVREIVEREGLYGRGT